MLTEDPVPELLCEVKNNAAATTAAMLAEQEKNYYCQRCLNHGELKPRKGHKPDCGYLKCPCPECTMVEMRRQLNNQLSKKKIHVLPTTQTHNGKRVRDPHCARCSAHGVLVPLRGHKRSMCQFVTCDCNLCRLVEDRRTLMAAQIKLRRSQQKCRDGKETKVRRVRKTRDFNMEAMKQIMMVVQVEDQKLSGTSTSPSPSSTTTTDTMSPALSISPPPSIPQSLDSTRQNTPQLVTPIAIPHPLIQTQNQLQFLQHQLILSYLQNLAPPLIEQSPPLSVISSPFNVNDQLGVLCNMYLKSCLKI